MADNTAGDISPQDMRDALVSWRMGTGQIYVPAASAAAVTLSDTGTYYEASNPAWSLSSSGVWFDESDGNGRLTYIGAAEVHAHCACTLSFTCGTNNQQIHARLGKNGTTDEASEVQFKIGTGTDVVSTAIHLITMLSSGDHLSLWVRNATGNNNITVQCANLQAVTMPM
jgi:hypothetical protein